MSTPETQKDLLAYLDRITRELGSAHTAKADFHASRFTTTAIAEALLISRNLASQYLNDLVRAGLLVKAGARPVHYFHRRTLERYFQTKLDRSTYPSVEELFSCRGAVTLDFAHAVGNGLSLRSCIGQLRAAMKYPPAGLPVLLCGAPGTGKSTLTRLMLEYGKNTEVLSPEAKLVTLSCSHIASETQAITETLFGVDGLINQCSGGIILIKDVQLLAPASQEALLNLVTSDTSADSSDTAPRFVLTTTLGQDDAEVRILARRIPIVVSVPSLCDRTQQEREELVLRFLREEGRRMGTDILISRGAFRCLASALFEGNVRELRSCITNCCAESYLGIKGDRLEIRSYQLPSKLLDASLLGYDEDDAQLIDTARGQTSAEDDYVTGLLETTLAAYRRFLDSELDESELEALVVERMRDLEDHLTFCHANATAKSSAYERIAADIIDDINTLYSSDLSRKSARLVAQTIQLQLWPSAGLSQWQSEHAREMYALLENLSQAHRFAGVVTDRIAEELSRSLGISLGTLARLVITAHVSLTGDPSSRRKSVGVILPHGYSTATSMADAANRILHTRVFEALDLPYDQQLKDIVGSLQQIVDRFSYVDEMVILVDMGSLQDIHKSLGATQGMSLGIINNVSTGLALEVGAGLIDGRGVSDILSTAAEQCRSTFSVVERSAQQDAILFCAEGGIDAAEKIKSLVAQSLPSDIGVRLVARDWRQLLANGSTDTLFSTYNVLAIIGTDDPRIAGIGFVALEDLVSGEGIQRVDHAFAHLLDADGLRAFHQNLVKNLTLKNVVESITILNPNKLFSEIESAVTRLQQLTGDTVGGRVTIGLYMHLCCLVERLVTRSPIESYADEERFATEHASFIEAFRQSFADISAHYRVEVPVTEIAYAYDYVNSRHAPRKHAPTEEGPKAQKDE